MKIIIALSIFFLSAVSHAHSQVNDSLVAKDVTQHMKDIFSLSDAQAEQIFRINLNARAEKKRLWDKYRNTKELNERMEQFDNRKDSLYQDVLGRVKYTRYKKRQARGIPAN